MGVNYKQLSTVERGRKREMPEPSFDDTGKLNGLRCPGKRRGDLHVP